MNTTNKNDDATKAGEKIATRTRLLEAHFFARTDRVAGP